MITPRDTAFPPLQFVVPFALHKLQQALAGGVSGRSSSHYLENV
jgi:hypothetical protein